MEDESRPFSESFWQMHRNTLILSSLLALTCLPGIRISETGNFFGLEPSDLTLSSLRWILWLSATYAFVAFANEWVHEALPYFRSRVGLHATARQRVHALADTITNELSNADSYLRSAHDNVSKLAALAPTVSAGRNPVEDLRTHLSSLKIDDEIARKRPDEFVKIYDLFYPPPRGTPSDADMPEFRRRQQAIGEILSNVRRQGASIALDRASVAAVERLNITSRSAVDDMSENLKLAAGELEKVRSLFEENRHYVRAMRFRLLLSQSTTTFRIWGIGIGAPSLAFLVAWALHLATLGVPVLSRLPHG